MTKSSAGFNSLPADYQDLIQKAQEKHRITISPLQEIAGGWSGAMVYLVSVIDNDTKKTEHLILKLDRKRPLATSDESVRHDTVLQKSPSEFAKNHIPHVAYERVESNGALAIFYAIAGQSLHNYKTLSQHRLQRQLEFLFSETNRYLLQEWNANHSFNQTEHPQTLFQKWLGFRLQPGQNIERFVRDECMLNPDVPGFIVRGKIFPNPLRYARSAEHWDEIRPLDTVSGFQHGDLNTNNILAAFSRNNDTLQGYFLIDFALFKENIPLLYDQRYLEISFLVHALSQTSLGRTIDLIVDLSNHASLSDSEAPVEMTGVNAAIRAGRAAFEEWVNKTHPSLHDDLWAQYWLAGAAAGLSYCHKAGQSGDVRLAGLVYAAANLKKFFELFGLAMPPEASRLSIAEQKDQDQTHKPAHNLPAPITHFIGRSDELKDISDLLQEPDVRLVTLTGPGGTGKTRLGLETGHSLLERFPHGVFFVDLAPISDPTLFATTTAHAMGIREGGSRPPLENLKDYLANRKVLLIFDNFEQITGAAEILAPLLAAAPGVKALVTSRIVLRLKGEHEYPVDSLSLPPNTNLPLEELKTYEAVALFIQQARAVRPNFEITEKNRNAIVEICRSLDGLPLAIEIAAARIKMLPPEALLKRLDDRLKLLVGGARDLPERQQTLRQAIDWSYDLLDEVEQELFSHLGVFSGGFSLEAAEKVCNPEGVIDIFSGIETLLENSLLRQVESSDDELRFDMLQTLRDYALEKTEESRALTSLRWAHLNYFAETAGGVMAVEIFGSQSLRWLRRIEKDQDNFRAALGWAMQHKEGFPAAVAIMTPLSWFWFRYGHLHEGREWTERAVNISSSLGDSPLKALSLLGRSYMALWTGDLIVATETAREAMEISERLNFEEGLSMSKLSYGVTLINRGRDKEAFSQLVEAIELYDQQELDWMKGTALVHLANVSLGLGEADQAISWLDMAMPFMEGSGDPWNKAFALNNYGEVARSRGDYETAEDFYRRTEKLFEEADAVGDQARLVHTMGYIALHKGDVSHSQKLFVSSLHDFQKLGNHRGIAECLAGLGGVAAEQGDFSRAAVLISTAEKQLHAFGGAWWPADRVEIERFEGEVRTALGEAFERIWAEGQAMNIDSAISYALSSQARDE